MPIGTAVVALASERCRGRTVVTGKVHKETSVKAEGDGSEKTVRLRIPYARAWNIAVRTAHIAVTSILVGGHAFDVPKPQLMVWLHLTIITGLLLAVIEAFPRWCWFYQGRGLFVLTKILLLALIPWAWDQRVLILLVVIVIASVGSHMPARFRYYSVIHRRVLD